MILKSLQGFKYKLFCWKIIFSNALSFLLLLLYKNKNGRGENWKGSPMHFPVAIFTDLVSLTKHKGFVLQCFAVHFVIHIWFHSLGALWVIRAINMSSVFIVCLFLMCTVQHNFSLSKVAQSPLCFFSSNCCWLNNDDVCGHGLDPALAPPSREAISLVCDAFPGTKGAPRKRKVHVWLIGRGTGGSRRSGDGAIGPPRGSRVLEWLLSGTVERGSRRKQQH